MCDDHSAGTPAGESQLSRRGFMQATGAAAAAVAVLGELPRLPLHSPARAAAADGTSAYSMAMHVHSSFSEQDGSMDSQLFQASTNSVDVLWWTDHDTRMDGIGYRKTVHFTSLTHERGGPGEGGPWHWMQAEAGPLVASQSGGGIVASPSSPSDPVPGGSLHVTAKSRNTFPARFGYYANCQPASWNYRDNLTGQSLLIDVLLTSGWQAGYLELLIVTSYHEAAGGRPAGDYALSYQFVPGGQARRAADGVRGTITIPVTPNSASDPWSTVTIKPAEDIAALWPDLDYRDFGLFKLTLSAVSTGDAAGGYFDYLRFQRSISGEAFFKQQGEMGAALAPQFPSVTQQQGLELSLGLPHLNWFGGSVRIPRYPSTSLTPSQYSKYLETTLVPDIHKAGGLVSYNHPFGYGDVPALPQARQDQLLVHLASQLLPTAAAPAAVGADLLEVGYPLRQGVDIAHHVALWDIMSRNAVFLTGNGTNDDHWGKNWFGKPNNWFSSVWAGGTSQAGLLAALVAGRAWCGSLSGYRGALDLLVDGSCPMGSASVSSVTSRKLAITATGLPANGSLQVLQGAVDYAGRDGLAANSQVVGTYSAAQLADRQVTRPVDTSKDSFVRTQVFDAAGTLIALSNPVWLLRHQPPGGIPVPRQV
jgi:hypothetical protein